MPQVGHKDALRDGAFRRRRVEQVPRHAREIGCLCQGGVPEGAVLRQDVQGRYGGQGLGGLLHQAIGFPCAVPCHRHELQPSREGIAVAFLREKGDGIALPAGAMHEGTGGIDAPSHGTVQRV